MKRTNKDNMPAIIEKYLAASERKDAVGFAELFSEDALYYDDGGIFRGRAEIRAWKQGFDAQLSIRNRVLQLSEDAGQYRLKLEAEGNFPGSPQVFVHYISLDAEGTHICELKIE